MVSTRLVGRADELSTLLAHRASDPPGAVLVTGEAGVGQTRLLDELAAGRLRGAAVLVLRSRRPTRALPAATTSPCSRAA